MHLSDLSQLKESSFDLNHKSRASHRELLKMLTGIFFILC